MINSKAEILQILNSTPKEAESYFKKAAEIRNNTIGNGVYLRGLIEISNICRKDCLYCGIRKSNSFNQTFTLTDEEILYSARWAYEHNLGSVVLQGGERCDKEYTLRIEKLIKEIKQLSRGNLGITLSLGEQEYDTYLRWFESGAHRYLLRIESSNEELYKKIHPKNSLHAFKTRLNCLESLQKIGYQTGSGVMIELPFQTKEDLANDLLFLKSINIDMVGMGPYLEHEHTPLFEYRDLIPSLQERLELGLRMVAALRLLIPDINIAATTALQAIDPFGREKAVATGANVMMPNIGPAFGRKNYNLYQNKPYSDEGAKEVLRKLQKSVEQHGGEIKLDKWGDSRHYFSRTNK
ncbi:MAG: [FeFe] hydrogenase H-cluster radical SAM maturase HydE [Odoribacter sp.]|nr:[FeFe] hydrogenase H-cluster radical SAM maturase HydE [Odoribacter sp.]